MQLNGNEKKISSPIILRNFLEEQGYNISRIAVEINGEIVPKTEYASYMVSDNDIMEIVSFVGGG